MTEGKEGVERKEGGIDRKEDGRQEFSTSKEVTV